MSGYPNTDPAGMGWEDKNAERAYKQCPYCSKNYTVRNDGMGIRLRKHYSVIPASNNLGLTILPGKKIVCPGSYVYIVSESEALP